MNTDKTYYKFWLSTVESLRLSPHKIRKLLEIYGDAENIYKADSDELKKIKGITDRTVANINESKKNTDIYRLFIKNIKNGMKVVFYDDEEYPESLYNLNDYPYALFYYGQLPQIDNPHISVVGSRTCTEYGITFTEGFSYEWSKMGIGIVSGLAAGIDTYAHKGALRAGGYTCAVLGCGVDICYPRINIDIYNTIKEKGCILSEHPPGTSPFSYNFPYRNRIIAAVSDALFVAEAKKKSGSLITVDQALEQGKDVYVLPGRINDPVSEGCNELIRSGAYLISSYKDIENSCAVTGKLSNKDMRKLYKDNIYRKNTHEDNNNTEKTFNESEISEKKQLNHSELYTRYGNEGKSVLDSNLDLLYSCLDFVPKSVEELIRITNLSSEDVISGLVMLTLQGKARQTSHNNYSIRII